eukprot:4178634-Karenia_brevis.AAC.1
MTLRWTKQLRVIPLDLETSVTSTGYTCMGTGLRKDRRGGKSSTIAFDRPIVINACQNTP